MQRSILIFFSHVNHLFPLNILSSSVQATFSDNVAPGLRTLIKLSIHKKKCAMPNCLFHQISCGENNYDSIPSYIPFNVSWGVSCLLICILLLSMNYLKSRGYFLYESKLPAYIKSSRTLTYAIAIAAVALAVMQSESILNTDFSEIISGLSWRYMDILEKFPVLTKSVTTGWMQLMGDYFAQLIENRNRFQGSGVVGVSWNREYDLRRGLSLFADGLILSGPLLHFAFELMERVFPTSEEKATIAALVHVILNDYLIDTIYLALSFVFVAVAEGHIKDLATIFRQDFWATVKASWATSLALIPFEFICFRYLSVTFRVLFMNVVDIFWGAIISFTAHRSRCKKDGLF